MTKPAVWVQYAVKKNRVDDKNLLHLKYPTCQKLWMFFLSVPMTVLLSKMVLSYPPKIDDFEIEEPWKIWKLICMASNPKSESGTNCWLTGPVKSLAALSNEGKPENIL